MRCWAVPSQRCDTRSGIITLASLEHINHLTMTFSVSSAQVCVCISESSFPSKDLLPQFPVSFAVDRRNGANRSNIGPASLKTSLEVHDLFEPIRLKRRNTTENENPNACLFRAQYLL